MDDEQSYGVLVVLVSSAAADGRQLQDFLCVGLARAVASTKEAVDKEQTRGMRWTRAAMRFTD